MDKLIKWAGVVCVLLVALFAVVLVSLCVGTSQVPLGRSLALLLNGDDGSVYYSVLFNIRLPRIIVGFAIGSALSLAGVVLQGMFRNPLVEPYTLGISGGAALGVCLGIVLRLGNLFGFITIPVFGFLGAVGVVGILYFISVRKNIINMQGILLTGVMISFICSSLFMLVMALSRLEDMHGIVFWTMGSLEESNWGLIKLMSAGSFIGLIISYFFCRDLNAFALGEEEAIHLGVSTQKAKKILFVVASFLTGASVSVAGIIGFVGLVIPHTMRNVFGADHRILLISSYLAGGAFLIICDTIARTVISPMELPVGVITGIIGGTIFIFILAKKGGR